MAGLAHQPGVHRRPAAVVADQQRRALGVGEVLVAPLAQRVDRRVEVAALLGQVVLGAAPLAGLAVLAALEHAVGEQQLEPVGEHGAGDPQVVLDVLEAVQAAGHFAHDQDDPGLADERDRAADGAVGDVPVEVIHKLHDSP
jgi:hypothetical protein